MVFRIAVMLSICALLSGRLSAQPSAAEPELLIRVWEVKRETTKEKDLIRIKAEVVNRYSKPLYIEVCCGWKNLPDRLHNPVVEQLTVRGEWTFVGGAYQDIPGGLHELKPGALFQSEIFVVHPCNALTMHCRGKKKYPFEIPIHGKHRIVLRYFYSPEDFEATIQFRGPKKPPKAVSKTFEIALATPP
jgi:hypothetical protein